MKLNFFGPIFRYTFLFVVLLKIFSYFGFLFPDFNHLVFLVVVFFALLFAFIKLEYGLYFILAELFVSSKGYLFWFNVGDIQVSLRLGLFLAVMLAWLFYFLRRRRLALRQSKFFWPYLLLGAFLIYGVVLAIFNGHGLANIFFDLNGYLFLALVVVFFEVIQSRQAILNILQVFLAGVLVIGIETVWLLYLFAHDTVVATPSVYWWIRLTGVGEITMMTRQFHRIFFQSHLYSLIGFFVFLVFWLYRRNILQRGGAVIESLAQSRSIFLYITVVLSFSTILISFSRSFWLSFLATLLVALFLIIFILRWHWRVVVKSSGVFLSIMIVSALLILAVVNFPYPKGYTGLFNGSLFKDRASALTGEAGVASRWSLLQPLMTEIKEHPILGQGFGATVTYQSSDPRILEQDPEGWYTTFAFEWGYLDTWLKIGLFGLLAYLYLLWRLWRTGWQLLHSDDVFVQSLSLGLLLGLVVVAVTNGVSPYLNHPLGIGYLLLMSSIVSYLINEPKPEEIVISETVITEEMVISQS